MALPTQLATVSFPNMDPESSAAIQQWVRFEIAEKMEIAHKVVDFIDGLDKKQTGLFTKIAEEDQRINNIVAGVIQVKAEADSKFCEVQSMKTEIDTSFRDMRDFISNFFRGSSEG
jgi:hypothetical protein